MRQSTADSTCPGNTQFGVGRCLIISLALLTLTGAASHAQESLGWETDYVAAVAEAKKANKPLLVGLYINYVNPSLEDQDKGLLAPATKAQLNDFVLVKQDLFKNPQWRHSMVWIMPEYLFIDPDGVIVYDHDQQINAEAFQKYRAFENERRELEKAQTASPNDFQTNYTLATWHRERLNRALAVDCMKKAALSQSDVKKQVETLLELSQVCVDQMSPWTDETTAQWALAEMTRLDPEDTYGLSGKVHLREIEIDIKEDRLREAAKRADEFLQSHPHHQLSGEVVVRKMYALTMLGEFAEGAEAAHVPDSNMVDKKILGQIEQERTSLESLAKLKAKCDQDPPNFDACVNLLWMVHDQPPTKGFWITYLRRVCQAKAPSRKEHLAMALALGSALVTEDAHANKAEAKHYFEEIINEKNPIDKDLQQQAREALEALQAMNKL